MVKEKTMERTMQRVIAAVITLMMILAMVPTYAFAETDLQAACKAKTNEEFIDFMIASSVCPICGDGDLIDKTDSGWSASNREWLLNHINGEEWYTHEWGTGINPCFETLFMNGVKSIYSVVDSIPTDSAIVQWLLSEDNTDADSSDVSTITIETEASTINVTVPTNAPFIFKADGTNVYPTNYEITNNNGLTAITLDAIDFEGVNGWSLTTEDDTFQADVKKFALKMGQRGNNLSIVDAADGVSFAGDTEIKIAPNGSKVLDFEAKRGVFSSPVTTENAMQMTMHFDWEHAA